MTITMLFVELTDPATAGPVTIRIDQIAAMYPLPPAEGEAPATVVVLTEGAESIVVIETQRQVLDLIADTYRTAAGA